MLVRVITWEGKAFLYLLCCLLAYRLLTRQIRLDGLLCREGVRKGISPERVQLLVTTIAVGVRYVSQVAHSTSGAMPDVDHSWLYLYGGSSGIYAAVKAALSRKRT